jgi:hypothetical protein
LLTVPSNERKIPCAFIGSDPKTTRGETLKLKEALRQAGIPFGAYDGLRQSGRASFISDRIAQKDGLALEHVLALKAFALLRAHGVNRAGAGAAVEAAFPRIRDWVDGACFRSAETYKVGVRIFLVRGKTRVVPLEGALDVDTEIGRIEFDMRVIATLLPLTARSEPKLPPSS